MAESSPLDTLRKCVEQLSSSPDPAKPGRDAAHELLKRLWEARDNDSPPFLIVPDDLRELIFQLWKWDVACGRGTPLFSYVQGRLLWGYHDMPNNGRITAIATVCDDACLSMWLQSH